MTEPERTTVYIMPHLRKGLRLKAAETGHNISQLVNEAVTLLLAEDADDIDALEDRKNEPTRPFEAFVAELRANGDL